MTKDTALREAERLLASVYGTNARSMHSDQLSALAQLASAYIALAAQLPEDPVLT